MKPLVVTTKEQLIQVVEAKVPAVLGRDIKCRLPEGTNIYPGFGDWLKWRFKLRLRG